MVLVGKLDQRVAHGFKSVRNNLAHDGEWRRQNLAEISDDRGPALILVNADARPVGSGDDADHRRPPFILRHANSSAAFARPFKCNGTARIFEPRLPPDRLEQSYASNTRIMSNITEYGCVQSYEFIVYNGLDIFRGNFIQVSDAAEKFSKGGIRSFGSQTALTERGPLGGVLLAKIGASGLCIDGEEERILTLLAIAQRCAAAPLC